MSKNHLKAIEIGVEETYIPVALEQCPIKAQAVDEIIRKLERIDNEQTQMEKEANNAKKRSRRNAR